MLAPALVTSPALAFYGVLLLVIISVSEATILAALIYRSYVLTKSTDLSALSEGREV